MAIRREDVELVIEPPVASEDSSEDNNILPARVLETVHKGPYVEVWLQVGQLILRSAITPQIFSRIKPVPATDVFIVIAKECVLAI